jgi:hypothetical protein
LINIVRFQELFNILYDEKIDCKLIRSNLLEDRMLNWNRINGKCNYIYGKKRNINMPNYNWD